MNIAEWTLGVIDSEARFKPMHSDGDRIHAGSDVAFLEGSARSILTAERLILNFLSILSGISTETAKYADIASKYGVKILDTRKTVPLLRYLEKYAVSVGGGSNHRMNLGEMVMVKDNHHMVLGHRPDINRLRRRIPKNVKIEVETDSLPEFEKVLMDRPDMIMLDNMTPGDVAEAVQSRNAKNLSGKVMLEASGGITLSNLEGYAATGVDFISIGAITDSIKAVDFSLDLI
jgi:nicotinate-nucleotide pyrophosphorylase (carboxylating)